MCSVPSGAGDDWWGARAGCKAGVGTEPNLLRVHMRQARRRLGEGRGGEGRGRVPAVAPKEWLRRRKQSCFLSICEAAPKECVLVGSLPSPGELESGK
jgi:transposase-like protein